MNIISDFTTRVNNLYPDTDNEELSALLTTIRNQEEELTLKDKEIEKLQKTLQLLKDNKKEEQKSETSKSKDRQAKKPSK